MTTRFTGSQVLYNDHTYTLTSEPGEFRETYVDARNERGQEVLLLVIIEGGRIISAALRNTPWAKVEHLSVGGSR